MINITFVIGQLSIGGSEKQLYLLAKTLQQNKNDYHVSVVVLSNISEPYGTLLKDQGIKVYNLKQNFHFVDFIRIIKLRKILNTNKTHIIISFSHTANYYSF